MKRVLLVSMPFGSSVRPSIGLSLLKAALIRDGLPCDLRYLDLGFAARIGQRAYEQISVGLPWRPLVGEWLFAPALFGEGLPAPERYLADVLHRPRAARTWRDLPALFRPEGAAGLLAIREAAGGFVEECLRAVPWEAYALVGFTTSFDQNTAALALARRLKARHPHLAVAFGGANCEGEMGLALHRLFPFVDFVCCGEGDIAFPRLARRVLEGGPVGDIPGIVRRVEGRTVAPAVAGDPVTDLDALPLPDYADYLAQRDGAGLGGEPPELLFETARGCWWGQKSHCTFCGLNGATMAFRAKSPQRALDEITTLAGRYGTRRLAAVDNIIDLRYLRDVLPRLAALDLELDVFYETKANLRREQVRLLGESGVVHIQPGIESLSSNVLRLMRKGVSALQNIQLLRWCAEYMVWPGWNLLAGFPGEQPGDYARQAQIVPLLTHLRPPGGLSRVRLDRFSPLFAAPEAMGLRHVRAMDAYSYVYPFPPEDLMGLAYYFDFDYADGRDPADYLGPLEREVRRWRSEAAGSQLTSLVDGDSLVVCDTRRVAARAEHRLTGAHRAVYEFCDRARTPSDVAAHLATLPAAQTSGADPRSVLEGLVAAGLTLHEDGHYLSLAVAGDYWLDRLARCHARGQPVPPRMRPARDRLLDPRTPALTALYVARLLAPSGAPGWAPAPVTPGPG